MRRSLPFAIIGLALLVAIGGGFALFRWKQPPSAKVAPVPPISSTVQKEPDKPAAESPHVRGGANARVTIEEFGDFQCLPCAELFPILAKAEEHYGERLRVIFRHKPLRKHEHAPLAARAAEAAGLQGRFWEMHDLLFQNSARWTKGIDTVGPDAPPSRRLESKVVAMEIEVREVFASYAERLKLDPERFTKDLDSAELKARVESDAAHADTLGIDRTPTLYLNGRLLGLSGFRSIDALQAEIDAELNGKGKEEAAASAQATASQPK